MTVSREAKDSAGEVSALIGLSTLYLSARGPTEDAARWGNEAILTSQKSGNMKLEVDARSAMVPLNLARKDSAEALRIVGDIRELHQKEADTDGELSAMQVMVDIHLQVDNPGEAQATAREAILSCQAFGNRKMEANF